MPRPIRNRFGVKAQAEDLYEKGDHRLAMWSMHIGKPLLGQRVEDVLSAANYLSSFPKVDSDAVHAVGIGQAGPVVLHSAVLDGEFASVTLRDSIQSWIEDAVARSKDLGAISHVVPSALRKYDLPQLAALLGNELTVE
jgi:hypothetical protein